MKESVKYCLVILVFFLMGVSLLSIETILEPEIFIEAFGPHSAFALIEVENQTDMSDTDTIPLTVWFKLKGEINKKTIVVFDGKYLDTTVDVENKVVTALIPSTFRKLPGEYAMYIYDTLNGDRSEVVSMKLQKRYLQIKKFGPKSITISADDSGKIKDTVVLWFQYEGVARPGIKLLWRGEELVTTVSQKTNTLTTPVPEELLKQGIFKVKLVDKEIGLSSNVVVVRVLSR